MLKNLDAIRACYLFVGADEGSLHKLALASKVKRFDQGSTLFHSGDEADHLYILLSGLVRIWIAGEDGRELTLALLEAGEPFGEIAVLDGLPRTANATVLEPAQCLLTPSRALEDVLETDTRLARHLIQLLCELLRRNTDAMGAFAFFGLDGRLAQKLHDLALTHAVLHGQTAKFNRKFSQTELANMLGVTREAVNKRLATMVVDGLLIQKDGFLEIPDLTAMKQRAQAASGSVRDRA